MSKYASDGGGDVGTIYSATFSRDGKYILTASLSGTTSVWDWQATVGGVVGNQPTLLRGSLNAVRGAAFSPDGRFVVTGSEDHTARVWTAQTTHQLNADSPLPDLIRLAAERVRPSRELTAEERKLYMGELKGR